MTRRLSAVLERRQQPGAPRAASRAAAALSPTNAGTSTPPTPRIAHGAPPSRATSLPTTGRAAGPASARSTPGGAWTTRPALGADGERHVSPAADHDASSQRRRVPGRPTHRGRPGWRDPGRGDCMCGVRSPATTGARPGIGSRGVRGPHHLDQLVEMVGRGRGAVPRRLPAARPTVRSPATAAVHPLCHRSDPDHPGRNRPETCHGPRAGGPHEPDRCVHRRSEARLIVSVGGMFRRRHAWPGRVVASTAGLTDYFGTALTVGDADLLHELAHQLEPAATMAGIDRGLAPAIVVAHPDLRLLLVRPGGCSTSAVRSTTWSTAPSWSRPSPECSTALVTASLTASARSSWWSWGQ
ncbi:hypothetical protein JOF36_007656 [Pseudonocardia parietis]|uniref:Uncharacterized protein n=1 Tax=Pseudonocardia parietis TaxID=570936 RepID=A0ABS4W6Z0_9PSEU|nr:hypothetical protein [Pseudonocardia parietis]